MGRNIRGTMGKAKGKRKKRHLIGGDPTSRREANQRPQQILEFWFEIVNARQVGAPFLLAPI